MTLLTVLAYATQTPQIINGAVGIAKLPEAAGKIATGSVQPQNQDNSDSQEQTGKPAAGTAQKPAAGSAQSKATPAGTADAPAPSPPTGMKSRPGSRLDPAVMRRFTGFEFGIAPPFERDQTTMLQAWRGAYRIMRGSDYTDTVFNVSCAVDSGPNSPAVSCDVLPSPDQPDSGEVRVFLSYTAPFDKYSFTVTAGNAATSKTAKIFLENRPDGLELRTGN